MVGVRARTNKNLVTCYGQSYWQYPLAGTTPVAAIRSAGYATLDCSIGGTGWVQFVKRYQGRILSAANSAGKTILVCMGGQTDLTNTTGRTGAQAYADMQTIATGAKAAGYDYAISVTMPECLGYITGTQDTVERVAYNAACVANSGGTFDAVVDIASHPSLLDSTNTTFFNADQLHLSQAGADIASGMIIAAIDNLRTTVSGYPTGLPCLKRTADNTGLFRATTATVTAADTTYSTAGQIIMDTRFEGNVKVTADDVWFINCEGVGKNSTTANHAFRVHWDTATSGGGFVRCKLGPSQYLPSSDANDGAQGAVMGRNMTLLYCDISGFCDGIGLAASSGSITDVFAHGNYIHDLWYSSPNSNHLTDGNHCDGVQGSTAGLSDVTFSYNTIKGLCNPALSNSQLQYPPVFSGSDLVSGNPWYTTYASLWNTLYGYPPWGTAALGFYRISGGLVNLYIIENWLDGGGYACVNIEDTFVDSNCQDVALINNKTGPNTRDKTSGLSYLLICGSGLSGDLTVTGNTDELTGAANNSVRH